MASGYTFTSQGITGTSTTAKVFKKSGLKKVAKNDTCLNPTTGHVYVCEKAGSPTVAKWKYSRTDIIGAPNIGYKNLSAPVRGNGNHKMTCTWKVPNDLVDPKNGRRATALLTTWTLGIPDSKDPKDVDKRTNESLTSDTIDLNNFKVGSKTYTRNSFYPNTKKKLASVSFSVVPVNKGKGSVVAKQTRKFEKPRTPSISAFSFNKENGELSCTITTNAGADYHERYDTRYKMYIYKSWEDKTTIYHDDSTTETSKTIKYDATGYQALTYEQYIRVKVEAWARGYAGDSEVTEKYYYIAYPAQATIRSVTFSGYTGTDKCTVKVDTNQVKNKNGRVTHPTDKVTLEYLANVPYSSASAIPADTTWEDSGNLDDGQCTALTMPVANLICDPGNWSYLRVVTYHANEDVLFRYSKYKRLDELHKDAPTAADDEIVVVSALPNPDGESADVTLAWDAVDGSSADDATGTELSWDTDRNAWRSTKEPSKHEFEWYDSGTITHKGITYRKKATITIKGLSEGETYYVRARRYLEGDVTTYGRYSPDVDPVVMTRSAEAIVASCDSFVAVGTSLPITWTLSGGGLQKSWSVVASNGTPIASGSGSIGYTQIDASRLARFAVNNVVTFTVQASTGTKPVVSESHTVRIVEKPTLEITGSSLVHVHEEDEQTYTGDIVEIDNSRDVLSTKSLLVTLDPIQDLHGYDKPWVGGAGKNKLQITATSQTINGVTFTVNEDGTVLVNGTATANAALFLITNEAEQELIDLDAPLILSGCPSGGSGSGYRLQWYLYEEGRTATDIGNGVTFQPLITNGNLSIVVSNGTTCNNLLFKPMIRLASEANATYEPYSNICPISGRTEVVTHRTGKNKIPYPYYYASGRVNRGITFTVKDDGTIVMNGTGDVSAQPFFQCTNKSQDPYLLSDTEYIMSQTTNTDKSFVIIYFFDANGTALTLPCSITYDDGTVVNANRTSITLNWGGTNHEWCKFSFVSSDPVHIQTDVRLIANAGTVTNATVQPMIRLASVSDATYELYNGNVYTTTLGQTVYGGVLDVVSGELVVDRAFVDLSQQSWLYQSAWASWYTDYFVDIKGTDTGTEIPNFVSDRFVAIATNYGLTPQDRIGITSTARGSLGCRILVKNGSTTEPPIGQLVYELATPQTYQLTPQEVELLLGQNNVWSDGDVELTTTEVLVDGDFLRTNNLSVNVRASTVCDLSVVVSSQGAVGQTPTGMRRQAFGDTVYSNLYRALQWTASGNAQTANVQLPTGLDFWDLGTYTVSIIAIDRTSGLKSDEVTLEVKVNWARKAPDPRDAIIITAVDEIDDTGYHIKGADIALTPPENSADTDVYDIYRYTGDGAELIGESFPLTYTARDLYAPFSEDGTQHYRIAIRTVDGDTEFADIEYIAEGEFLRFDWAEGYLELPYGVTMGDSYSKDVEFRKHMDGGTDGYWNENIERKGSYSSAVIKLIQPAEIDMARRLARFAGAVYVRTPEGTAYLADVQVTDLSRRNEAVMMVAFDATEVDLTAEYMLPTPYEKQD